SQRAGSQACPPFLLWRMTAGPLMVFVSMRVGLKRNELPEPDGRPYCVRPLLSTPVISRFSSVVYQPFTSCVYMRSYVAMRPQGSFLSTPIAAVKFCGYLVSGLK